MPTATSTMQPGASAPRAPERTGNRRLLSGATWVIIGKFVGIGGALLLQMVLARLLCQDDFGRFVLVLSMVTFFSVPARFGLHRLVLQRVSASLAHRRRDEAAHALRRTFRTATVSIPAVALVALVGMTQCGSYFHLEPTTRLILLILLGMSALSLLHITAEALRGFHRIPLATLCDGGASSPLLNVSLLLLFLAAASPLTVESAVGLHVAVLVAMAAVALWLLRRTAVAELSPERSESAKRSMAVSGMWTMCVSVALAELLAVVSLYADLWIAARCCPPSDLSLFAASRRLAFLAALPLNTINLAIISSIPELHSQGRLEQLQRILRLAATAATVPGLALALAFLIAPETVLSLVFGANYQSAAPLLRILALGQLCFCWSGACGHCLTLTGHFRAMLTIQAATTLFILALGPLAATEFGVEGLAVASALTVGIANVCMWLAARKLTGVWTHTTLRLNQRVSIA